MDTMNTPTNELLPCPFCGGEATLGDYFQEASDLGNDESWWLAQCDHCGIALPNTDSPTKEEAIKAWNTRHESL